MDIILGMESTFTISSVIDEIAWITGQIVAAERVVVRRLQGRRDRIGDRQQAVA